MREEASGRWQSIGTSIEGQTFILRGANVWSQEWRPIPGERAKVTDPAYGQPFVFDVFEIEVRGHVVRFAAGEYSANVWGFFVEA